MTVLMWRENEAGKTVGQCDARCYNSTRPYKNCACGGTNHAVGYSRALNNTRLLFQSGKQFKGYRFPSFISQEIFNLAVPVPEKGTG